MGEGNRQLSLRQLNLIEYMLANPSMSEYACAKNCDVPHSTYRGWKANGFTIGSKSIYNGVLSMSDTEHRGIYLGTDGIVLGKGAFKVDSNGNLTAKSGTFTGTVQAGKIDYGGDAGYLDGSGLASHSVYGSKIGYNTISTAYTSGGINTSLGYADFANGVFNGWNTAPKLSTENRGLVIGGHTIAIASTSFRDGNGGTISIKYLTWI